MSSATSDNWAAASNVLCVRLDTLGDVLMTTPAIRALRESLPGRRITLLTSPPGSPVARLVPEIDEVLLYQSPWMKATPPRCGPGPDLEMIGRLGAGRFDAAVIFTVFSQNPLPSAMLCYLAGIPRRLAHCRENPYQLLTDWIAETEPHARIRHEVQRQLDLVAEAGCRTANTRLSLRVPDTARRRVRRLLDDLGLSAAPRWAVIHPGSTAASRRYPPESFAAAARILAREHGFQIVLSGVADEKPLVDSIRSQAGVELCSLAGSLDLAEMAALLEQAPLLISNNTGPVHLAAAVGTPVVDLYALTNPQHTPWAVPHRVLSHDVSCRNCFKSVCPEGHHDCLRKITPQEVVRASLELLEEVNTR